MSLLALRGKPELKIRAIELRRQGNTYSEILKVIPVAKSTLSLWFHDVGLAEHQKQRITQKRIEGQKKGAAARRSIRINAQNDIWSKAKDEVGAISRRELWLLGIALYWAEGSKEKEWSVGHGVVFSNSDPRMIRVFLAWVAEFVEPDNREPAFSIYLHMTKAHLIGDVRKFWSRETGLPASRFSKVCFKKGNVATNRKNIGLLYNGLLRVRITRGSILLRKIEGWVRGIDADIAGSSNGRTPPFEGV